MIDTGHVETDNLILEIEKKVKREYQKAAKEVRKKLDDYLSKFEIKDKIWQGKVKSGEVSESDYQKWKASQIMSGNRWKELQENLAMDLHNSNLISRSIITGYMPEVYAINHNFGTYQVEIAGKIDTSYTLYSRETVERILRDDPELLQPPGPQMKRTFSEWDAYTSGQPVQLSAKKKKAFDKLLAQNKDIRWQEGKLQSVTLQSILQGESIPNMARRIAREMGEINHKVTIRYARTAMTGAENAGRQDAYKRAADMGVNLQRRWVATLDMRTRHEHRLLDMQVRNIDEPFEVAGEKIMFPGDPTASPGLIWNCRCTEVPVVAGWVSQSIKGRSLDAVEGMTYDEWKNERKSSAGKGNEKRL